MPAGSPSLSNRAGDRDQDIITCYEKSGDIALLYLQEMEKVSSSLTSRPYYPVTQITVPGG